MNCIFCKIAKKEIPSRIVYEDDAVLAFEDIAPQAPIHILIIPKKHYSTLLELNEEDRELLGHILLIAKNIAEQKGIDKSGFRIVMNCNSDGGQTVFHIHFHLLGGRQMHWPPG